MQSTPGELIKCGGVQQHALEIEPDDSRMQALRQVRQLIEEGLQELSMARAKLLTARNMVAEIQAFGPAVKSLEDVTPHQRGLLTGTMSPPDIQQCGLCSGYGHTTDMHPQQSHMAYVGGGPSLTHKHEGGAGWTEHDHLGGARPHYHDDAGFQVPITGPWPLEHPSSRSPE
jgi:hypothetical protein